MRFEKSIEIEADEQQVWDVLSDLEAWPQRIETVDSVELLTPPPLAEGSRVRLKQPKLPEGTWDMTVWEPPSYFEYRQTSRGISIVAGHRVETLGEGRSRLILDLEMRGTMVPIVGRLSSKMTNRYMETEARGIKLAAEQRVAPD